MADSKGTNRPFNRLIDSTFPGEPGRAPRHITSERFHESSCFALTEAGLEFAASLSADTEAQPCFKSVPETAKPTWIVSLRQLQFRKQIIKKCRTRARNQERILAAFEEEHWPQCIDDPLPPAAGIDAAMRLNKAVYRLNHSLHPPLIHFSCNGGNAVYWEERVNLDEDV